MNGNQKFWLALGGTLIASIIVLEIILMLTPGGLKDVSIIYDFVGFYVIFVAPGAIAAQQARKQECQLKKQHLEGA